MTRELLARNAQGAHRVYDSEDADADVGEDGEPHIGKAEGTEDQNEELDAEGEDDIFLRDAQRPYRNFARLGQSCEIVAHNDDVGTFNRAVLPSLSHSDADRG